MALFQKLKNRDRTAPFTLYINTSFVDFLNCTVLLDQRAPTNLKSLEMLCSNRMYCMYIIHVTENRDSKTDTNRRKCVYMETL